jgi:alpha-galactosidase
MTEDEYRTQMSLWAILAAPLIVTSDVRRISPAALAILTNPDVITIDQDTLGKQGDRLYAEGQFEVWGRDLSNGARAIAIFNRAAPYRGLNSQPFTIDLRNFGFKPSSRIEDLWRHTLIKPDGSILHLTIPAHGSILLRMANDQSSPPHAS